MAHIIQVDKKLAGLNIKQFFKNHYPHLPYPLVQTWLRKGEVKLNGKKIMPTDILQLDDKLKLPPPHFMDAPPPAATTMNGEEASKKLQHITIFETRDYQIINKPAGLAVQGGSGLRTSLDDWLMAINRDILRGQANQTYKLVHRLDRDTSGVMILARGREMAQILTAQFHGHDIKKTYLAVVMANAEATLPSIIDVPLKQDTHKNMEKMTATSSSDPDGLSAVTHVKILAARNHDGKKLYLLQCNPLSGRKHQLRAHLSHVGFPIVGDRKYGDRAPLPAELGKIVGNNLLLHALELHLELAVKQGDKPAAKTYRAPPPAYFPLAYFAKDFAKDSAGDFARLFPTKIGMNRA